MKVLNNSMEVGGLVWKGGFKETTRGNGEGDKGFPSWRERRARGIIARGIIQQRRRENVQCGNRQMGNGECWYGMGWAGLSERACQRPLPLSATGIWEPAAFYIWGKNFTVRPEGGRMIRQPIHQAEVPYANRIS